MPAVDWTEDVVSWVLSEMGESSSKRVKLKTLFKLAKMERRSEEAMVELSLALSTAGIFVTPALAKVGDHVLENELFTIIRTLIKQCISPTAGPNTDGTVTLIYDSTYHVTISKNVIRVRRDKAVPSNSVNA